MSVKEGRTGAFARAMPALLVTDLLRLARTEKLRKRAGEFKKEVAMNNLLSMFKNMKRFIEKSVDQKFKWFSNKAYQKLL